MWRLKEKLTIKKYSYFMFINLKKAFAAISLSVSFASLDHYGERGIASELYPSFITEYNIEI